jgi:hypothetical protein
LGEKAVYCPVISLLPPTYRQADEKGQQKCRGKGKYVDEVYSQTVDVVVNASAVASEDFQRGVTENGSKGCCNEQKRDQAY